MGWVVNFENNNHYNTIPTLDLAMLLASARQKTAHKRLKTRKEKLASWRTLSQLQSKMANV